MTLKEQIDSDIKNAMKSGNSLEVSVLRLVKTAVRNAEIDKKAEFSDDDVIAVFEKQAKQRRDSITQYEAGGRDELAQQEKDELVILNTYLPEKMDEQEIKEVLSTMLESMSDEEKSNFGRVMGASMKELKGKADPETVKKAVNELIGGK